MRAIVVENLFARLDGPQAGHGETLLFVVDVSLFC
jgi:hypothetical protein